MAAERDRRRSKNLGHSRWPGHRIALEPYQGRKGRTRPAAAHAAMTVMHRVRHAFGFPTHPATQALPFHGVLRKATVPNRVSGTVLIFAVAGETSGRKQGLNSVGDRSFRLLNSITESATELSFAGRIFLSPQATGKFR